VCAMEDFVSFPYYESSIYRHLTWALFPCHSKISSSIRDLRLFKTEVTEFVGSLITDTPCCCKNLEVKYEDNT